MARVIRHQQRLFSQRLSSYMARRGANQRRDVMQMCSKILA